MRRWKSKIRIQNEEQAERLLRGGSAFTRPRLRSRAVIRIFDFCRQLHADQRGTISIVNIFVLLAFTMLLVMIVNVATHLDEKVKMQNAADAAAYSGGVMLARGMNAVAFTNHLLTDVFAMTAFLREARDRKAETLTPEVLDEWDRVAGQFETATFEKFAQLGQAMREKVPLERQLVASFSQLSQTASVYSLPIFETILQEQMIPEFQRNLVRTLPGLAQQATAEIARRHAMTPSELRQLSGGGNFNSDRPQLGVLWRMSGFPVGYPDESDPLTRTLPAVDPAPAGEDAFRIPNPDAYLTTALTQRRELAKHYLEQWNATKLRIFDRDARMSQFNNLWRIFTCANLEQLLNEEFPDSNLPMIMRDTEFGADFHTSEETATPIDRDEFLERNFQFLSIVYRRHRTETGPGVFRNPLATQTDAQGFAQISLFIPRPRRYRAGPRAPQEDVSLGGTFGFDSGLTIPQEPPSGEVRPEDERWPSENWPSHWDLLNQNWMVQLVPTTARATPQLLQTPPPPEWGEFRVPVLEGLTIQQMNQINTH